MQTMVRLNEQVIHDSSEHSKLPELFESYLSSPSSPHASKSLSSCSSLLLTLLCIKEGERERGRGRRREERGGRRGEGERDRGRDCFNQSTSNKHTFFLPCSGSCQNQQRFPVFQIHKSIQEV